MNLLKQFYSKLSRISISDNKIFSRIRSVVSDLTDKDFDEEFLNPNKLDLISKVYTISIELLYHNYYKEVLSNYGNSIKELRSNLNLTQKYLAKLSSLSPISIGKFENEISFPS
ncbi:MAG: helix-turn-helix transcriptional regulator, partial [Clostridium sp.]